MSKYHQWLLELTAKPTAAGREAAVEQWVERFAARRRDVTLSRDRYGNITLARDGGKARKPIYLEAHMDHPAFVVQKVIDNRHVEAEFRGGVKRSYFQGSRILLHHGNAVQRGVVKEALSDDQPQWLVRFNKDVIASPGDVMTWDVGKTRIVGDRLRASACDDLSGVAAALAAFDQLRDQPQVRVLLTRAEEIGFIGAIAACKARTVPKTARMICLENSKSFAESPIGGGPIVRVGDYTSTFDPDLTYRVGKIAEAIAAADHTYRWQRKLMPGGTCEASAFQSYGYTATCICLPLGNYHNMNETTGRIAAETISITDFDHLIRLLIALGRTLDQPGQAPPLKARLEQLFAERRSVLNG